MFSCGTGCYTPAPPLKCSHNLKTRSLQRSRSSELALSALPASPAAIFLGSLSWSFALSSSQPLSLKGWSLSCPPLARIVGPYALRAFLGSYPQFWLQAAHIFLLSKFYGFYWIHLLSYLGLCTDGHRNLAWCAATCPYDINYHLQDRSLSDADLPQPRKVFHSRKGWNLDLTWSFPAASWPDCAWPLHWGLSCGEHHPRHCVCAHSVGSSNLCSSFSYLNFFFARPQIPSARVRSSLRWCIVRSWRSRAHRRRSSPTTHPPSTVAFLKL